MNKSKALDLKGSVQEKYNIDDEKNDDDPNAEVGEYSEQ